jgi:hypothetical protein
MSAPADYQTDLAQGTPNPSWKAPTGGCGCTGGRRHRKHKLTKRGGVGAVDDALFAVGTTYAAKRFGRKKRLGGRHTRRHRGGIGAVDDALFAVGTTYAAKRFGRKKRLGGAGGVDDALVAGTALGLAHYFTKKGKKGGARRRVLPRRLTRKALV